MPGTFLCNTSLLNLQVAHPRPDDILRKGALSVIQSNVPGPCNPIDMTIEQTINHHVKSAGGIVAFSRNIPAYHRWCVTMHALLKWQVWTTLMTPFTKHLRLAQIQQSERTSQNCVRLLEISLIHLTLSAEMLCIVFMWSKGAPSHRE